MVDRVLFWIDAGLIHFGIAKNLQEKLNADLYVIYDFNNHLTKSFKNQKLVNFKKEWYFWEHLSGINKNVDIEYLKKFEEKFGINLWEIAYTERAFGKDNPFYKFKREEILSIFEQECKFFEKVLGEVKPNFLMIKTTDLHRNHLLAEICRASGVKILMFSASRLGFRSYISSQSDKIDHDLDEQRENEIEINSFEDLREYLKKYDKFQQAKGIDSGGMNIPLGKKTMQSIRWMTKTFDEEYKEDYVHYGVTRYRAVKEYLSVLLKGRYRKYFIDKNFVREIIPNEKFLLFPLQIQPERNVDIDAPFYSNQIEVITNIAKALPVGFKLYVKEHPKMYLRHWREISDYKKIMRLPNVRLIHPTVSSKTLLDRCSIVITIAGTVGLEAAIHKKPCIVFSDTIYSSLPSVYRLRNLEELSQVIKTSLKKEVILSDVSKFISLLDRNSFDYDFFGNHQKILDEFHGGGFLISDEISMSELKSFLEKNKESYETLTLEHIKKINQYKKLELKNISKE
tara:strand:+ start:264 stop:1799 length:1536 start_codon:yes stop_codon:yes gene_type:complete